MERRSWINWTLSLAVFAALLHIVGFIAPMWLWLEKGVFTAGVGLWFATGCGIKGTCGNVTTPSVSFGYSSDDTFVKPSFKAVQALQTVGVAGETLLLLFLIVYRIGYGRWRHVGQLNTAAFITSLLTWLCILVGLIVYCAHYWPVVGTSPLVSSISFPWSLLMCLFAAIVFMGVSVLTRLRCRDTDYVKHAIPTSGDAQMDLHPVTKHGLLHRYFAPAYHDSRRPNHAIACRDDVSSFSGMNGHLIGSGERHVEPIENVAFNEGYCLSLLTGNNLENGVSYHYLPSRIEYYVPSSSQTEVQRPVPNIVLTHQDSHHEGCTATTPTHDSHMTEGAANRRTVLYPSAGMGYQYGKVPLDLPGYSNSAPRRDVEYQISQTFTPPVITASTAFVAGVTGRGTILADHTTDNRFTADGRLTANAEYLNIPQGPRTDSRAFSQTDSAASGSALLHTTHLGPIGPPTSNLQPMGASVRPYDPSYIYRPVHEQIY